MADFTRKQKNLVWARDIGCVVHSSPGCVISSVPHPADFCRCSKRLVVRHRFNKGEGGLRRKNSVANGMLVCSLANTMMDMDAQASRIASLFGWKLHTSQEIKTVPLFLPNIRKYVFLDDSGYYREERP